MKPLGAIAVEVFKGMVDAYEDYGEAEDLHFWRNKAVKAERRIKLLETIVRKFEGNVDILEGQIDTLERLAQDRFDKLLIAQNKVTRLEANFEVKPLDEENPYDPHDPTLLINSMTEPSMVVTEPLLPEEVEPEDLGYVKILDDIHNKYAKDSWGKVVHIPSSVFYHVQIADGFYVYPTTTVEFHKTLPEGEELYIINNDNE
jgi:hypothetical protein